MTLSFDKPNPDALSIDSGALTAAIARYAVTSNFAAHPAVVQREAVRAFLNWLGCALGGSQEKAVKLALEVALELGSSSQATVLGDKRRVDVASAAALNCMSSSILAFDDAHLATVTHPSGPVCAAALAFSETQSVSGKEFLNAIVIGIEIQCRLARILVLPPSKFNVGFYVSGLTAPIGVAATIGRLMGLDEQRMNWALGLAASQASGFRATHGTMTAHFRPAHATRSGVIAAKLAALGFTGDDQSLEANKGFLDVYSSGADVSAGMAGLGKEYELLSNSYKPYPCGIVIHPTLDACFELVNQLEGSERVCDATLKVHPLALSLTGIRSPKTPLESHVSLFHWAAAALVRKSAGVAEMQDACINDPQVSELREKIIAVADEQLGSHQAVAEARLSSGRTIRAQVTDVRGSKTKPLTDSELEKKFHSLASTWIPDAHVKQMIGTCRRIEELTDVGAAIRDLVNLA
ncbi:MmgE/PrpD family protein [Caballeronia calidae]|uniref:MmgE/PrpD family protein n=1 Tax=Caballeronia calidae TaxID=1777139 RepID=A0A158EFG8_9BURK|nr:MmgE/PrpD family protein [Caballeronia calidae]SAL05642.1 MmgE/PrpD family protein [Caballeronia calidae]